MQRRGFLLLVGATVLLVAAAIFVLVRGDRQVSRAEPGERALPGLAPKLGELAWMRLSRGAMRVDFAAIGGHWMVVEKGNYPADGAKVDRLLLALADLTLIEPKTQRPELFARLGVDDPNNGNATLVAVQDRTGAAIGELIVGKRRSDRLGGGNDAVYVRRPGTDRAWLARGSLDVSDDLANWLDRHILDISAARIASIKLTDAEGATLSISRPSTDEKFVIDDLPADAKVKNDTLVAEPAGALDALGLDDVRPSADLPVPDHGVATATFTAFDGLSVQLFLFERDQVNWIAVDASGSGNTENEAKTIDDRLSHWTFAIPEARAKLLRTKLADLIEAAKGS